MPVLTDLNKAAFMLFCCRSVNSVNTENLDRRGKCTLVSGPHVSWQSLTVCRSYSDSAHSLPALRPVMIVLNTFNICINSVSFPFIPSL